MEIEGTSTKLLMFYLYLIYLYKKKVWSVTLQMLVKNKPKYKALLLHRFNSNLNHSQQ